MFSSLKTEKISRKVLRTSSESDFGWFDDGAGRTSGPGSRSDPGHIAGGNINF